MEKKMLPLAIFVVANLCVSMAFAIAPVGPPTAGLETGQWSVGFDYAHSEIDFDIDMKSDIVAGLPKSKAKGMKSDAYLVKFNYGISDNWEFYGFLGAADSRGKIEDEGGIVDGSLDFDGGSNFSGGFGTKWTFLKEEQLSWGVVYQMSWSQGNDSFIDDLTAFGGGAAEKVDADIDSYDIFLALGPTYEMGNWRVYGGAVLYYYNADVDVKAMNTTIATGDVGETMFGGYVGTVVDLDDSTSLYFDYILANDVWAIGTGVTWKF